MLGVSTVLENQTQGPGSPSTIVTSSTPSFTYRRSSAPVFSCIHGPHRTRCHRLQGQRGEKEPLGRPGLCEASLRVSFLQCTSLKALFRTEIGHGQWAHRQPLALGALATLLPVPNSRVSERPPGHRKTLSRWGQDAAHGQRARSCHSSPLAPTGWVLRPRLHSLKGRPHQRGKGTHRHLGPRRLIISWQVSSRVAA